MKKLMFLCLITAMISCQKDEEQEFNFKSVTVTPVKTGSDATFTDISAGTKGNVFLCGAMGVLMKSTDGGSNWMDLNTEIKPSLVCIQALDDKNVYVARNELYHTKDGGANWETAGLENVGSSIFDIVFLNASVGFIAKNGVMKTTDSGKTWVQKYDSGDIEDDLYYALSYNKIQFVNQTVGYCGGGRTYDGTSVGNICKTTDGGETWVSLNLKMSQVNSFQFLDENVGFIFNFDKELWKTTDGGQNWVLVSDKVPGSYLSCYFIDETKVVIQTQDRVYHSIDGGLSWTNDFTLESSGLLTKMKFSDSQNGFILGNEGFLAKISLN